MKKCGIRLGHIRIEKHILTETFSCLDLDFLHYTWGECFIDLSLDVPDSNELGLLLLSIIIQDTEETSFSQL